MTNDFERLCQTPEKAVTELEALALGDPWADTGGEAARAVADLQRHAVAAIFPSSLVPVSEATLRDLSACVGRVHGVSVEQIVDAFVVEHGQALAGDHGELAAALRSPRGLHALRRALNDFAPRIARPAGEVEAEGTADAMQVIAMQLHQAGQLEPASHILAETVPALRGRLDDARVNHQAHVAAELDRLEAERAEADAVIQRERAEAQRQADAQATEAERVAARARHQADKQRADALADRLERIGGNLRLGTETYRADALARAMRNGDFGASRMVAIEQALRLGGAA